MSTGYSEIHWVTITPSGEEGWLDCEIEHPQTCGLVESGIQRPGEPPLMEHDCWVQFDFNYVGSDMFSGFPLGERVAFRCWSSGPDRNGEYDGGVEIVEERIEKEQT